MRALTRSGQSGSSSLQRHSDLVYDQIGKVAEIGGKKLELLAREMGLLEILLRCAGRIVSKEQLVEHPREWGEEVSANAIEV